MAELEKNRKNGKKPGEKCECEHPTPFYEDDRLGLAADALGMVPGPVGGFVNLTVNPVLHGASAVKAIGEGQYARAAREGLAAGASFVQGTETLAGKEGATAELAARVLSSVASSTGRGLVNVASLAGRGLASAASATLPYAAPAAAVMAAGAAGYGAGRLLDNGVDWIGDKITGDEKADHSLSGMMADKMFDWIHGDKEKE